MNQLFNSVPEMELRIEFLLNQFRDGTNLLSYAR